MNQRRIAAVQAGLLMIAMCAYAVEKKSAIQITVLDSESRSVTVDDSGVPKNCDAVNFDAYCHNSKTAVVTNTLLVQEGDQPPFRISCTADTKWSRCVPLLQGHTFEAKRDKRGFLVFYADENGKVRKQLYTVVDPEPNEAPPAKATKTAAASPAPAANISEPREGVKCSFSSTPPGAEVTVDGRYVGSTPSVLALSVGNHTVEVSLPGFVRWKRDLTVSSGSELTVNAVLQKAQ